MKHSELTQKDLIEWVFKGFITIILGLGMYLVRDFSSTLKNVEQSISGLNVNLARLVERDTGQNQRLDRHEKRLDNLEYAQRNGHRPSNIRR